MLVTVRIPTVLQKLTDGQDEILTAGGTVRDIIAELRTSHVDLVQRITTDDGSVKPYLNVFVNGEDIRFANHLETRTRDGDEVSIIPSIAGG